MASTLSPAPRSARALATAPLVVGPVLLLAGVLLMPVPDAWTVSHLVFLAGTLAMLPAGLALHELLRETTSPWVRQSALALTATGTLALAGQFLVDFVVIRLAAGEDRLAAEMFDRIQGSLTLSLTLYLAGPALLFTGLAVSGAALIVRSGPRHWPGWALVGGPVLVGLARITEARPVEVVGLMLILAALARTARSATIAAASVPARPDRPPRRFDSYA
jgi:hypothetical protein